MRILVIADIHANWPALAAIQEPFDACICVGDLVEYGPTPAPVVDWVREHCLYCVRGNHDHGTAQNVDILGVGGFRYLTMATRPATIDLLNSSQKRYLSRLPTTAMFTLDGLRFMLVHATPRDPLDEYCAPDPTQWAPRIAGLNVDFLCVGHTHVQFMLKVGQTTILNPGSVGLQRDGNPTVRYAVIENGQVTMREIPYAIEETIAHLENSPFHARAQEMLRDVYRAGRFIHPTNGNGNGNGNGSGIYGSMSSLITG